MKIGRKGFMLAETLVVSVVIVTVLVTLFAGVNNVSTAYDVRNRYYDVDSLYVAIEINEILKRNNVLLNDATIGVNTVSDWALGLDANISSEVQSFEQFYLYEVGDAISTYILPYTETELLSLKNLNSNLTFSDYLDYLRENLIFDDDYDYLLIVERKENNNIDDCYYYALKLKY